MSVYESAFLSLIVVTATALASYQFATAQWLLCGFDVTMATLWLTVLTGAKR